MVGPFLTDRRALDLAAAQARLLADGAPVGDNAGPHVMDRPVHALLHCLRTLARPIPAGTIVTSGGTIRPADAKEGGTLMAQIDRLVPLTCIVAAH